MGREGLSNLLLFTFYAASSVTGLLLLKRHVSAARTSIETGSLLTTSTVGVAVGGGLYVLGFVAWLLILSREDLSVAYPIAVGLTLALTTVAGWWLLHEPVTVQTVAGVALVAAGVLILAR